MNYAAGILIVAGDRFLLVRRADGSWCVPGGKAELGETMEQAACRETLEEVGLAVTGALQFIGKSVNPDGFEFTCFRADCPMFEPVLSDEHDAYQWARLDNLPRPLFMSTEQFAKASMTATAMDAAPSARILDRNGWYEIKDNPISKVGVFPYLGKNIPGADPTKMYSVYRPAEELSDPETIASFRLVPWIDNHVMLGNVPGTVRAEDKGVHGVTGETVYFAGDTLYSNIKLFSATQGAVIDAGKKDLSLGYRCKYEHAPGVFNGVPYEYVQRQIRGNHVASVTDGRMGADVAVMDSAFSFTFDSKDFEIMDKETPAAGGGTGGAEMSVADMVKQLTPLLPVMQKLMALGGNTATAAEPVVDKAPTPAAAVVDAAPAAVAKDADEAAKRAATEAAAADTAEKEKTAAAMDAMPLTVIRAIAARDKLAGQISQHVGAFDHSEMTPAEVVAYGVDKLGLKEKVGAHPPATFLAAYLEAKAVPTTARAAVGFDAADKQPAAGKMPEWLTNGIKE